jgi:hypothetical protein
VSAQWEGEELVIWRLTNSSVGQVEVTDRTSVQQDGRRLRTSRSIEVPGQPMPFESTIVYMRKGE